MKHNRRSIRLKEYDYTQAGAYFITVCAYNRECLFGRIVGANGGSPNMVLNECGKIIKNEWQRTGDIRPNVEMDCFVIMPNHIHGIINIVGAHCNVPLHEKFGQSTPNSIPTVIKLFKSTTTKQINILHNTYGRSVWQRNYYEHVIRDEHDLNRIREYIINNPAKWEEDDYYDI